MILCSFPMFFKNRAINYKLDVLYGKYSSFHGKIENKVGKRN